MKKRTLSVYLIVIFLFTMSLSVFAASGISEDEQKVMDALNRKITTKSNTTLTLPKHYVNQIYNYLTKDGVDLTQAQCHTIISKIDNVLDLISDSDIEDFNKMPLDMRNRIVKVGQEAGETIGMKLSFDTISKTMILKDSSGSAVIAGGIIVKKTGINFTITITAFILLMALAGFCIVQAKKSDLMSKQ